MNTPSKVPRTIPAVIKAMNATNEEQQVELYENLLASMFGTPILIFGSIANIVFRNLMWHEPYEDTLLASIMFMTLAILFQILTRLPIRIRFMTHIMSFLVAAWFFFIICDFYDYIGPAVLTIGYIQIMIANTRTNRIMLYYVSVGVFISGLYVWAFYRDMPLVLGDIYYGVQCGLFFLLFIFAYLVQQVNRNRLNRISKLMEEALQQKEDTMSLYEEIAATEEELRSQNEQLKAYNETIRKNEENLNHLAYYDTLTELPNRKTIMERLQLLIHLNKRHPIYIVFIDVDDFKRVNDTMGHYAGDTLIKKVSETLNDTVHPDDLVGRLGGDEFALIIHRPLDDEDVLQYIDEIRLHISEIQFMESYEIRTSASFGVSVYPHDGEEEIELMKSADTAMYKAKELGKNGIQFFRREMKEEIVQRIQMEKQLNDALENGEFFLAFQPQFALDNNSIRGFEALIRWKSPEMGIISPVEFIPIAEKTGLIIPIGQWVLRTACRLFRELCDQYQFDGFISVNISAVQIRDKKFMQGVDDILRETQIDTGHLELEITESMFLDSTKSTVDLLKAIKKHGIHIALDDFGTGYSSLNYLKKLPIDTLKIDKSFIDDIKTGNEPKHLLGDMISMAHHLNLSVIAEGVETNEQLTYLRNHDCDYAQGYLLGKPMELKTLKALIESKATGQR